MKAFGTRTRASLAALLSAALITSGALLAAPAAYAADDAAPAAETPVAEAPAAAPEEAPVETPEAPEAPVVEAPAPETPAAEQPAAEQEAAATPPAKAQAGGAVVAGALDASEYGITVSKTTGVENGETLTVNGVLPEKVLDNGTEKNTSIYLMWCVNPGEGNRASGAQCSSTQQQWLSGVTAPPATQNGSVADGVWTFSTTMAVPASFGAHECLADGGEQCGVFVRLAHTFNGAGTSTQFDQFVPVTFAQTPPPVEYGITVSKTSDVEAGEELTVNGVLPAKILNGGSEKDASVYLMWCVNPGEGNRASGAQCSSAQQQWLSGVTAPPATQKGSVADGVWTFETTMTPPASFGAHECLADGDKECGVFVRLAHTFSGEGATQFDQFVPVTFAETPPPVEYGITVSKTSDVEAGEELTVNGVLPAKILNGGSEKDASVYLMWCVNPGEGNRASGAQCSSAQQQWLSGVTAPPATQKGSVADGVWTFETTMTPPASFGAHECLADGDKECGVFVRLAHTFSGEGATQFDQFVPVTFAETPPPVEYGITVSKTSDVEAGETLTIDGVLPEKVLDNGTEKNTSIYLMWCVDPGEGARASGAQCDSSRQQWLSGVASPPATQNGTVADGVWTFSTTMAAPASFGAHECLADGEEQCGVFVRLAHTFNGAGTSTQFDQFVPVTFEETQTEPEYGITVSKTSGVEAGEAVTVNGVLPAKILNGGSEKDASVYLMWCVDPGDGNRASGAQCSSAQQQWLSGVTAPPATQNGTVADGVWTFSTTMTPPASFGAHECLADGEEQCGVFVRLAHTFSGEGATQFDQFVPVTFAPTAAETEYGISVAGSVSAVSAGDVLRVSGAFPEKSTAGGSEKNTSVYLMWCVNPGEGNRASGAQCEGSQQWLMHTSEYGQPATGTVADGVWTFDTDFEVPASAFGEHECLADGDEQCGLFVRLAHTFSGEGATQFDQFLPVTFKSTPVAPVQGSASVKKASTSGITVNAALSSLTPGALPNGIQLAVVLRGTSTTATSFVSQRVSVASVSESLNRDLLVSRANLDRSRQYEVVVWTTGATPTTTTLVKVLPFNITSSQWNAVFPPATTPTPGAGSLTWGVSTEFADYINSNIAKGSVNTSGVGGGRGGYVFPQATSGSWNPETRTGTVQYRGSVNFWGHDGAINMTFANPVITVTSPISGTISAGGQTFPLNLASAGFRANADGSVTWSGVSVSGAISGGGGGGGGSVGMDSLSFTVGSVSGANFGSTTTTSPFAQKRTAAATPPATTGITVVTPAEDIVAGGEIEITATGFQPNEQGILVVIYSDPTVLDRNAKADENGVVRWIGKLPKNLDGKHTITLQGSINVGQEITVAKADSAKVKEKAAEAAQSSGQQPQAAGGIAPAEGTPAWVWWTAALALLVVAGASTGLVVAQRRRNDAPTHL